MEEQEDFEDFSIDEFYDDEPPKRKGFVGLIKSALGFKEEVLEEVVHQERNEFIEFVEDIPDYVSDEDYENTKEVSLLCTRSIGIITQKMILLSNCKNIEREIHNTKYISDLTDEDIQKLRRQIELFLNLSRENTRLMYQVTSYNKAVSELQGKTEQANKVLPEIEHSEKQAKLIKSDIYLIESERSEIYESYDKMSNSLEIIDKVSIVSLVLFTLITFILMYLNIFNSVHVLLYIITLMIVVIFSVGGMYIAKLKLRKAIKLNLKKQARAVELLNKKNAVLAHHTNFLNYEYKRFNAQNSINLRSNLAEFEEYKKVANRKSATRRSLEETEAELKDFFRERGKTLPNISVEKFVDMIDIENKKMHYDRLILERVRVEEEVEKLDLEQEELWNHIEYLQNITSERNYIADIIKAYYSKLEKIMNNYKDVFIAEDDDDDENINKGTTSTSF